MKPIDKLAWAKEYFWMAKELVLEKETSAVSKWFIKQGIFKKEKLKMARVTG